MRPIGATVAAVDELDAYLDDGRLLDGLVGLGDRVRAVVPDTIGLSVASAEHGVTFTVVATEAEVAAGDLGGLGVRSTLTLPLQVLGLVRGSVDLYGASEHAFDGHHDEIARICGAPGGGAVTNADLDFRSRLLAEQAPAILRAEARVETAVGVLTSVLGIGFGEARGRLAAAAERADVQPHLLAAAVLTLLAG